MIHCHEIVQIVLFKCILGKEVKVKTLVNLHILVHIFGAIGWGGCLTCLNTRNKFSQAICSRSEEQPLNF